MSSTSSLTIEQRLDRLYTRRTQAANGSTSSHDPHSGILDWRPATSTTTSSAPLLKKARHRPRPDDPAPKEVDEAAIAKLKRVDDDQITKIFAEMTDLGGGAALSPVVIHCARLRQFAPKTSFEQARKIAQSSRQRLDDRDDDSSGLEETDDDDDKTPLAGGAVGGAVCAPLPEERPVTATTSSPEMRKTESRSRRQRSRSPPDRRTDHLPPAPPPQRVHKVGCSPAAATATATSASPSLGTSSMESPTVGLSNQSVLVQQSAKWKDAVKLKRLADKMKKEVPLSEGWCKRQEMYMSAGLKFLEAAEMFSCAHSYQNTAQYFERIIQIYLSAGCQFFTSIGYECSAVALYRAMQVKRKDFTFQANQLLAHLRLHQTRHTATATESEPLTFPSKLAEMLSSYLRHSKCVWDYMDDWDKARAYRPGVDVLQAHGLEVLESLDDLDMTKFVEHVRRALSSSYTS